MARSSCYIALRVPPLPEDEAGNPVSTSTNIGERINRLTQFVTTGRWITGWEGPTDDELDEDPYAEPSPVVSTENPGDPEGLGNALLCLAGDAVSVFPVDDHAARVLYFAYADDDALTTAFENASHFLPTTHSLELIPR